MRRIIGLILAFLLLMPIAMPIDRALAQTGAAIRATVHRLKIARGARLSVIPGHYAAALERIRAVIPPGASMIGALYPDTS